MVPDALIDACHLVGPAARIKDRVQRWLAAGKKGHVGAMLIAPSSRRRSRCWLRRSSRAQCVG